MYVCCEDRVIGRQEIESLASCDVVGEACVEECGRLTRWNTEKMKNLHARSGEVQVMFSTILGELNVGGRQTGLVNRSQVYVCHDGKSFPCVGRLTCCSRGKEV